jgi:hypothetical protein
MRLPLRGAVGAHVGGIAPALDLGDERAGAGIVVAEDVLHEERAARPHVAAICRTAGPTFAK